MPPAKRRRGNGPDDQPDLRELIETNISNATQEIKTVVNNLEKQLGNVSKTILEKIEKMETQIESDSKKSLGKKFVLNEIFCDILTMKNGDYRDGKCYEHFGQKWRIFVKRLDDYLGVYLSINKLTNVEEWSADTFHSFELSVEQEYHETMRMKGLPKG